MKHLKEFKIFESLADIEKICKDLGIKNFTVNPDGTVDVNGDVNISRRGLTKIPIKFGKVSGYFYCNLNKITSLEGSPSYVGGSFWCEYNRLTSLEGSPSYVGGNFWCLNNSIKSLKGGPISVGDDFYCSSNNLKTLDDCPQSVGGVFYCSNNPVCEIWKLFKDFSKVEFFNEIDIIRGDSIILDRLNHFLEEIGKPTVTGVKGYKTI